MIKHDPSVPLKKLYDAQQYMLRVNYQKWTEDVLFTFNWWFLIVLTLTPFFIWWKLVDKSRLMEILFVGLSLTLVGTLFDVLGGALSFWTYEYKIVQMLPALSPVDFSILPISYMLIYQWIPKWKPYIVILILLAAFGSFVAEPIFAWMKIYHLNTWKYIYSFPIYIAMGIGIKALSQKIMTIQSRTKNKN